jgi:hypothetical protein
MQPKLWENIILEESIKLSLSELRILNKKLNLILQKKTELKKYGKKNKMETPIK